MENILRTIIIENKCIPLNKRPFNDLTDLVFQCKLNNDILFLFRLLTHRLFS